MAAEKIFALKGGTAINLFITDMPRLSIDIDLVYLPLSDGDTALAETAEALTRIGEAIRRNIERAEIVRSFEQQHDALCLFVAQGNDRIKIELSPVLRGADFPVEEREVSPAVEDRFGYVAMQLLSMPDLYAGKICAALDRQHPRDLFDVKLLLENEGLSPELVQTFLVYLISHNRRMAELLKPTRKDIAALYEREFLPMSRTDISLDELHAVRETLISKLNDALTSDQKQFLLSFKAREPGWDLLGLDGVDKLPAVKWKLQNLAKMPAEKHREALGALQAVLSEHPAAPRTARKA